MKVLKTSKNMRQISGIHQYHVLLFKFFFYKSCLKEKKKFIAAASSLHGAMALETGKFFKQFV